MSFKVYENKNPNPNPPPETDMQLPKWVRRLFILAALILMLFILGNIAISLLAEYIWMDSLHFGAVFTTILTARVALFAAGFIVYSAALFFILLGIRRVYMQDIENERIPPVIRRNKYFIWINLGISIIFGLIGSSLVQGLGWERFLMYFNQASFGVDDPTFGHDIGFYVYSLPFWNFILNLLLGLVLILLIVQAVAFSVFQLYIRNRWARFQLIISVMALAILLGISHFLGRYDPLLTNTVNFFMQESVVYGASYTDHMVNIPLAYVMAVVSVLSAIIFIIGMNRKSITMLVAVPVLYFGIMIAGNVGAMLVQQFVVTPNEYNREQVYLEYNRDFTRQAYGLDQIETFDHPAESTLSQDLLNDNQLTLDNVRINDPQPLLSFYNSRQTIRTYYQFNDVDVDRYIIDGDYQQVLIGARELDTSNLPSQAQTWVNRTLRYTHGYGVAVSNVNEVTAQGQPEYLVQDLPTQGEIEVTRPQIYFGEQHYNNVIVGTEMDEFDYPDQDGDASHTYRFSEDTGIQLSLANRLIYALEEMSPRTLISGYVQNESQLLRKRNIVDRVQSIAPFLTYDEDPYIVIRDDGTMVWIIDAYTSTSQYPYSEPVVGSINHIRNPVKAVVDAYSGEVNFYVVEPDDPLLQTYQNIFPTMFTTDIPDDIQAHFRYPLNLFNYQAEMYRTYHMSDLEVFYNREDMWQFPMERYYGNDVRMQPYYITMQMPESDNEEFILMQPFTPNNRQNMISWMGARNDGEHYGELFVHRFPSDRSVYGPQQIENRINQDSYISQQLNLWSQGGSRVIRGNLMVIPIEDTLLYVEPIYIESDSDNALPEVQQIIIAYDDYIVMEDNFENAMMSMLNLVEAGIPVDEVEDIQDDPLVGTAEELVDELSELFANYTDALSAGNWQEAAGMLSELERQLAEWEAEQEEVEQEPDAEGIPDEEATEDMPAEIEGSPGEENQVDTETNE